MKQSKKKSNPWEDHYSRRARKERFPARSVYKLKEIQKKHRLIKKGHRVLDLGCAPGSWLLYAAEQTGNKGRVFGIDLKTVTIDTPAWVEILTGDVLNRETPVWDGVDRNFDIVLSDMAPSTTGNRTVDAARSFNLCTAALATAEERLRSGGSFVCKIFQGEDFGTFLNTVKKVFRKTGIFKPQSSRKASKEIFIIAEGRK